MSDLLKNFFIGSEEVWFESAYGLDESVEHLRSATRRSVFSSLAEQSAVGSVKKNGVSLQRNIPMVGNSFKPFFRGRFIERDGKVYLTGRFTMHWLVKIFMTIWFGAILSGTLLSLFQAMVKQKMELVTFALAPMGMLVFGVALVWVGKWFARNDIEWLSAVISKALRRSDHIDQIREQSANRKRPMVLNVVAAFLFISAIMSIVMALGDINSAQTSRNGLMIVRGLPESYLKGLGLGYGVLMLALAYGVFKRQLFAWRTGLVLIAFGWGYSVIDMFMRGGEENMPPQEFKYIMVIFSTLVVLFWLKWWHAQRIHFLP